MNNSPPLSQAITKPQAAAELQERRGARSHLLNFTTYTFPKYIVDPAHELIAEHLDAVVAGEIDRLMIYAPPQSGKSELTSVRLPCYWLGRRPNDPVILSSYGASLATDKSKQARGIVESQLYRNLFPEVQTRQDSRRSENWKLASPNRGYMLAAGVDGPVTGHGARLIIIDDPFENWKAAQSPTIRENVWQWYQGTIRTRLWEGGAIILIMTRWHEDDLAGRLLDSQPGRWEVLRIAALAETQKERDENNRFLGLEIGQPDPLGREPGEPATPQRFSKETMLEIKNDVGSVVWNAEYQGVPRPPEGNRIKRSWLKIVGAAPRKGRRVRYWDKAATEGGGDYACGLLMCEYDGMYFIEDVIRGQWSSYERQKVMLLTAILDASTYGDIEIKNADFDDFKPDEVEFIVKDPGPQIYLEQEPGSSGVDSFKADVKLLAGFRVRKDRPSGDKGVRGEPFAAQAEAGNVFLVKAPWNWDYINEITTFPNAAHDDQWDGTSGAFNHLARPKTVSAYGSKSKDRKKAR